MTKNPPSIAVLSSHTPSLFWFRLDMMREFFRRGYAVYALGNEAEEKWAPRFAENGIAYRQIPVIRNGMNPLKDRKTIAAIQAQLERIMPEKLFVYQAKTVIYGAMAANRLGITEVYPLIAGMGSVFVSDSLITRAVRPVLVAMYRRAMKKCPAVFFQNRDDERIFRDRRIVRDQKVVLLHGSGVNTERFTAQPLPEKPAFLCVSRLIRDKGVYEYLCACRRMKQTHPGVECLLVGPYDSNFSTLRPEELQPFLEDGSVSYVGEQEDVRPWLARCSVFVLPSYREGTPKANLEAMASGRAVITTDAPGCRETVRDGENGFLVPVRSVDAIFEKMEWSLDHPEEVAAMGRKGREMAEQIFDVRKVNAVICRTMGLSEAAAAGSPADCYDGR